MNNKYQNSKIYKITNDKNNDVIYGYTLSSLGKHLYSLRKRGKVEEWHKIRLIEKYSCNNKKELDERLKEKKQEDEERKTPAIERKQEYMKKWRKEHKKEIKMKDKQYYENHKDEYKQYQEQYRKNNAEKIKQNLKQYYETNKKELNKTRLEKIQCECGSEFCRIHLSRHMKTKKHIEYINKHKTQTTAPPNEPYGEQDAT